MDFLSYKQAAELMGIPLGTLYCYVSTGRLPHHRLGPRLVRFKREDLLTWIEDHRVSEKQD